MAGIHRLYTAKLSLLLAAMAGVCFGQFSNSVSSSAAKVVTATGRVSVLKDSQPWALDAGDTVQMRQMIMTGPDGHATFQVSDGSTFEVYPNSQVVFRNNPGSWRDLVDVVLGRIRVHIEHLGNQPNPNKVSTPVAVISVRGTTFVVSVDEDDETTFVEVEEGVVVVDHKLLPSGQKTLSAGESLRVYKSQPLAKSLVEKGTVARKLLQMAVDAVSTYATHAPKLGGIGGGTAGGGGVGVGDTGKTTPPPPPPPPLPPALP